MDLHTSYQQMQKILRNAYNIVFFIFNRIYLFWSWELSAKVDCTVKLKWYFNYTQLCMTSHSVKSCSAGLRFYTKRGFFRWQNSKNVLFFSSKIVNMGLLGVKFVTFDQKRKIVGLWVTEQNFKRFLGEKWKGDLKSLKERTFGCGSAPGEVPSRTWIDSIYRTIK